MTTEIFIQEYNQAWPELFEQEKKSILEVLGKQIVDVQHFGSTSVPGLAAKPIIDLMVSVEDPLAPPEFYAEKLEQFGYCLENWPGQPAEHLFFRKVTPVAFNLHIIINKSYEQERHLFFRDYLRHNIQARQQYEALKRDLALRYQNDRFGYTRAKSEFIKSIEQQLARSNVKP